MALVLPTQGSEITSSLILPGRNTPTTPTTPTTSTTPQVSIPGFQPFQGKGYGASNQLDISGRPLAVVPMKIPKTFMSPETSASVVDKTRTAVGFDPTIAQPIPRSILENPRMAESLSHSIRQALGATAAQQLDHVIPVSLGGSNNKLNLHLEPTVKGVNTATDPIEYQNFKDAKDGKISLVQALRNIAQAKGITLTEDKAQNNPINQFLLEHGNILKPLAAAQNAIEGVGSFVKSAFTQPKSTLVGAGSAIENFGLGVAKLLVQGLTSNPLLTPVGISGQPSETKTAIQNKAVDWIQTNKDALNTLFQENFANTTDKAKAYQVGSLIGSMVPYYLTGEAAGAALKGVSLPLLTKYGGELTAKGISTIGKALENAGNAAGFLGTGQIIHDPQDGSRAIQLRNDLLTYALFETGLKIVPKGVSAVLDKIKSGDKITLQEGEAAVAEANKVLDVKPISEAVQTGNVSEINKSLATAQGTSPRLPENTPVSVPPEVKTTTAIHQPQLAPEIQPKVEKVPPSQLPVGGGTTKTSGLEARIKSSLDNAPEDVKNLSTYQQMNNKAVIKKAVDYISKNGENDAIAVLKGEKVAPKDIPVNSLYVALSQDAKTNSDLALKLTSLRATRYGQELEILKEIDQNNPVKYMTDYSSSRIEALGGQQEVKRLIDTEIKAAKKATTSSNLVKTDWNAFVESIKC